MSRMHKKRMAKRNAYEQQKAMSEMLSASSQQDDNAIDTNAVPDSAESKKTETDTVNADSNVIAVPDGAQIGPVEPDSGISSDDMKSDDTNTNNTSTTNDANDESVSDSSQMPHTISTGMSTSSDSVDASNEDDITNQNADVASTKLVVTNVDDNAAAVDSTSNDTADGKQNDTAIDSPELTTAVIHDATAAKMIDADADNAKSDAPQPELTDDLTPSPVETLQEQADRIAKEESRRTLEAIDEQTNTGTDTEKEIEAFISQRIKDSLDERDELRKRDDKNGVSRVGKRLNEIAKLRNSDDPDRTLDDVKTAYDKIMKDEDDRLTLIAQREAEIEEKERIKRVDKLAIRLKSMPIAEAKDAIADIDGNDYMTLAERHAELVSDITSYVEEQPTDDTTDVPDTDASDVTSDPSTPTNDASATVTTVSDDAEQSDKQDPDSNQQSNGLKEYYERYGGEPGYRRAGQDHSDKPQSEKSKRRQERKQREKARQELLAQRAAERAEERAKQEGISVEEAISRGDKPLTDEEIEKRNKAHRSKKLTALSVIKSVLGIASIGGIEGYAIYEALKSVHNDGTALSGFASVEHMIAPMLIVVAVWFVLSLVLRAVSKSAASKIIDVKVDRDANIKTIAYLSADRGVCGKTILIDVLRAVSMIISGALTLTAVGALAGSDTAMGVSYGIAVLLTAVGIVGKHMYLFGSDDDDEDSTDDDSVTYGLAEIQRHIELINSVFRPLLAAAVASIVVMSIVTFMPLRTGTELFDLGTDAWLPFGAIAALALGRCIAIWMPRGAEDVTSFSSFAWSLFLMFGLSAATALFVIGQYAPSAIAAVLIALVCIGLKILGRGRESIADLNDYEIE